jgi:putative Mn2+ efflux pump MntP
MEAKKAVIAGVWFGAFQMLMPIIGYFAGTSLSRFVTEIDHWIVFVILALIGGNMIREAMGESQPEPGFGPKEMFPLAVATSIDALAIGVSFAFLKVNIWESSSMIGIVTFFIAAAGVYVGSIFGVKFKKSAEIAGGIILILIGIKVLVTHLMGAAG